MTSSSGPGMSLKQEGISYLVADELPAVIVNMARGGPGMGNISPVQSDYLQATRGGGHGDYRTIVLAPASVQELAELVPLAFDLADEYRNPVVILGDGMLGQMMEPVDFDHWRPEDYREKTTCSPGPRAGPARTHLSAHLRRQAPGREELEAPAEVPPHRAERGALRNLPRRRRRDDRGGLWDGRPDSQGRHQAAAAGRPEGRAWSGPSRSGPSRIRRSGDWPRRVKRLLRVRDEQRTDGRRRQAGARGQRQCSFLRKTGGVIPTPVELYRIVSRTHYHQAQRRKQP